MQRVVVTGGGLICGLGSNTLSVMNGLRNCKNATKYMEEWDYYTKLRTKLACPVIDTIYPESRRTHNMGRVGILALMATDEALLDAKILTSDFDKSKSLRNHELLSSGRVGIAYGSSMSSMDSIYEFAKMHRYHDSRTIKSTTYLKGMPHTCAATLSMAYGLQGRLFNTSEACTSSSSAIGIAYETIQSGKQDIMIAGGADELTPQMAMVFDCLGVTSLKNQTPTKTPRPFDSKGDGLVVGEGAGTLILESLDHALKRNAHIYAEVVGFATNMGCDNPTTPNTNNMQACMKLALNCIETPTKIGYINMHGTATNSGDEAESLATYCIFGKSVPVSTTKSYIGHTLAACGAIEAWLSIQMMNQKWFHPNLNLEQRRLNCSDLDYITGQGLEKDVEYIMSNNFAFAGINTSLIFKKRAEV